MCLILFALHQHPRYPLVLAANRDELYERPSRRLGFWDDAPEVLAGRDLEAGGTWLGVTRQGRFAAVTNFRAPGEPGDFRSRGELTRDFLQGATAPLDYLRAVEERAEQYRGFNLLVGHWGPTPQLAYLSNRDGQPPRLLPPGLYGLSNHWLDSDWYKVRRGKARLQALLNASPTTAGLLTLLGDNQRAPEAELPDTGVGISFERLLSPIFIASERYGTRAATALIADANGQLHLSEQNFLRGRPQGEAARFQLRLDSAG